MTDNPMRALERARAAWEAAGRPGAEPQLTIFGTHRYAVPEAVRGERADRPRKRKRRR